MFQIYDLEVLRNYFLYVGLSLKEDKFDIYEISIFRNDLLDLIKHLKSLGGQIGFNNLSYDGQMQEFILRNYHKWTKLEGADIARILYEYSQSVIYKSNNNEWPDYREKNLSIRQLDLLKVWHYDNKARRCSLKWLQYSMDWHNIEDMPIHHSTLIEDRKTADSIIEYCKNDCLSTRQHYKVTIGDTTNKLYEGIDKIQLRKDVKSEFGFECINFSDVKIGDEIMKTNYSKVTGIDKYDLRPVNQIIEPFTFKDCLPDYSFKTEELNNFINQFSDTIIDLEKDQHFKLKFDDVEYTLARGGLHSKDRARLIKPMSSEILRDADVGSMYPNFIRKKKLYPRHLGEAWLQGYTSIIDLRLNAKAKFKETKEKKYKSFDEAFKLALNGGSFGKTGEKSSWQYDPLVSMKITIGCQIELLMLIEALVLGGIRVMSANTDGIVCLFDKSKENEYNSICKEWEVKVGNDKMGMLEYADYSLFAQLSVNDYIAIKTDNTPKHKGDFMVDFELHKNKSFRIIPLALEAYYLKGLNPARFIREHTNIFDFCAGVRAKEGWHFEMRFLEGSMIRTEKLQKTVRYYISKNGSKILKCNVDGRLLQVNAGKNYSTIYTKHIEQPIDKYDINYEFYIDKLYDIISKVEPTVINKDYTQMALF